MRRLDDYEYSASQNFDGECEFNEYGNPLNNLKNVNLKNIFIEENI